MDTRPVEIERRQRFVRNIMMSGIATSLLLSTGCGWWRGAKEGSPGHVSKANEACATLFCTADEELRTEGQCAPSCMCGAYTFAEATYDEYDIHALRSWRLLNPPAVLPGDPYSDPSLVGSLTPAYCAAIPGRSKPSRAHVPARDIPKRAGCSRGRWSDYTSRQVRRLFVVPGPSGLHRTEEPAARGARMRPSRNVRGRDTDELSSRSRLHGRMRPDLELQRRQYALRLSGTLHGKSPVKQHHVRRKLERVPRVR